MSDLKREWRYQFTAERWGRFLHTRLWLALPAAAAISFVVIILIGIAGDMEQGILLAEAGKMVILTLVAGLFGIISATSSSPEAVHEKISKERAEAKAMYRSTSKGRAIFWVVVLGLLTVALIFLPILLTEEWASIKDPEGAIKIAGSVIAGSTVVCMQLIEEVRTRRNS